MTVTSTTSTGSSSTTSSSPTTQLASSSVNRSGLTVDQMIQPRLQPYQVQISTLNSQISANTTKVTAYQNMQSLLQGLQSVALQLDTQAGSTDVFANRAATLSASGSTNANTLLSASVAPGTAIGTHQLQIQQVATAERLASRTLSSRTSALSLSGAFTIGESGKSTATINVTSGMALNDIVAAVNNQTTTTGVTASVITVSSNQYKLVLTGQDTNQTIQMSETDGLGVLTGLGLTSLTSASQASATTSVGNAAGSITINGTSVALTAGMSLNQIRDAINAAGITGVTAAVNGTGPYTLSVSTTGGTPVKLADPNGLLSGIGLTANVLQSAQPAILNVDGVNNIQRNTNSINDILDGVTLNLTQASPGTTITLGIGYDTQGTMTAIQNFASAYNSWETFVGSNEATTSGGTASAKAVLFGDSTMRGVDQGVQSAITALINNTSLGAIGLSLNQSNQLQINAGTLSTALTTNFTQVQSLFEYQATSSSGDLHLADHTNATFNGSLTLNVTYSGGAVTAATDQSGVAFNVSGGTITGRAGTIYAGLTFGFTGTTSESITVNASQGIADQINQVTNGAINSTTGSVTGVISNLQLQDTTMQGQVGTLTTEMNSYQNFLLTQYGQLESTISKANQTASILQTMMSYDTSSH